MRINEDHYREETLHAKCEMCGKRNSPNYMVKTKGKVKNVRLCDKCKIYFELIKDHKGGAIL